MTSADAEFFRLIVGIVAWVLLGTIGGRMFAHRGFSPLIGVAVGVLLGPVWLAVCWFVPMTKVSRSEFNAHRAMATKGDEKKACSQCGRLCGGLATLCPECHHRFEPQESASPCA